MTKYENIECISTITTDAKADIKAIKVRYYTMKKWWLILLLIGISTGTCFVSFISLGTIGIIIAFLFNVILFFLGGFAITKKAIININGEVIKFTK